MAANQEKITVPHFREFKKSGRNVVACTAYDYSMASLVDAAGVDVMLVGDSLGSVIQGEETTLSVTMEQMIYHCSCVSKAANRALVVGDMPFMSYQPGISHAVEAACRIIKEGRVSAVKIEGGVAVFDTISRLAELDIPVMGHVGLTPQSYHRMGGHRIQGRERGTGGRPGSRERILADARAVASAGAFAVVLEGMPADLAAEITAELEIPTIGIGAGPDCDGQILVINDLLGLSLKTPPPFVRQYANLAGTVTAAVRDFASDVRSGAFPDKTRNIKSVNNGSRVSRI